MKHFKWILCNKYKEFNSIAIVRIIKESFIYHLLKALFMIMLMTLLIFQIKPQKAYIYAELEQVKLSSMDYRAEVLEVSDIPQNYASISSMDKIVIDLEGLSINDIDYSDGKYLEICPAGSMGSLISFSGLIDKVYFNDATSNVNQYGTIYSNSSTYWFVGEQHLKVNYGTAYVVDTINKERKELEYKEELLLMKTMHRDIINEHKELINNIMENDGRISGENEKEYQINTNIIDRFSNEEAYSIRIYIEPVDTEFTDIQLENVFVNFNSINSEQINSCGVIASGKLTISYTPIAEEYTLKRQELFLLSEDSSLNISYDIKKGITFISGYVDKATLSRMNLFPDFWNWYFSNIYMAPLTLISTVFAGVSMMSTSKRNK